MYPIERLLGELKKSVRNRAKPEGSIIEAWVQYESLNFCGMYLKDVDTAFNRPRRNNDGGVRNEKLSVFAQSARPFGDPARGESLSINDMEVNKLKSLNSPTYSEELYNLAFGPIRAELFSSCHVNGVKFLGTARDDKLCTQNSGVHVPGGGESTDIDFYGKLTTVVQLLYKDRYQVIMFKCRWFDTNPNRQGSVKIDHGLLSVNINRTWYDDDPYILANMATQIVYLDDPKAGNGWKVVQKMDQRNVYAIPELDPTDNEVDNVADQRFESSMENDAETLRDTNVIQEPFQLQGVSSLEIPIQSITIDLGNLPRYEVPVGPNDESDDDEDWETETSSRAPLVSESSSSSSRASQTSIPPPPFTSSPNTSLQPFPFSPSSSSGLRPPAVPLLPVFFLQPCLPLSLTKKPQILSAAVPLSRPELTMFRILEACSILQMSNLIRSRKAVTTAQMSSPPTQPSAATAPAQMDHMLVGHCTGSPAPASSASSVAQPVSARPKKNTRGPCRQLKTAKVTRVTNNRINIGYDERHRAATTAELHSSLAHDIGHVIRAHCPMKWKSWKVMPDETRMEANYNLEDLNEESLTYVNRLLGERYKQWKSDLHHHFQTFDDPEVALREGCPQELEGREDSWAWLCSHFQEGGYLTTMVEKSQLVLQESASQLPPDTPLESVDPPHDAGFQILTETLDQTLGRRPGTYCRGMGNARRRESRAR
ncbi:unnamed protein product, partial [Prunus brigantina]